MQDADDEYRNVLQTIKDEMLACLETSVSIAHHGMRVTDVLVAIKTLAEKGKPRRIILCGRRDAALVACLAAAVEPAIDQVACEQLLLSFRPLFAERGFPINAASILPGLLQHFGDVPDILAQIAPRKVLAAAGIGDLPRRLTHVQAISRLFSTDPQFLADWMPS